MAAPPPLPPPTLPSGRGLLLLLVALGALLVGIGASTGLVGSTETRYAEIAREMRARGDYVVPTLNGAPHLEKPPFAYWALAAAFAAFGVGDVVARLPGLLAAALTVLVVAGAARRHAPAGLDPRATGRGAAVMLGTMPAFLLLAQTVSTDPWLVLASTVAGVAVLDGARAGGRPGLRSVLALHAALGVGFLVKGPAVLLTPAAGAVAAAAAARSLRPLRPFVHPLGLAVLAAVAVPWFVVADARVPGLLDVFLRNRSAGGVFAGAHHDNSVLVVWVPVVLGAAPWVGTWVGAGPALRRRGLLAPVLAMALAAPVFFTIATSRLFTYPMPALPFVALGAALGAPGAGDDGPAARAWRVHGRRATVAFAAVTAVAAAATLALALPDDAAAVLGVKGYVATLPGGMTAARAALVALGGVVAAGAALAARGRSDGWTRWAGPTVAGGFLVFLAGAYAHAPEAVGANRRLLDDVAPLVGPDDEVGVAVHKDGDWALMSFYLGREARWFGYGARLGVKPPSAYAPRNFQELDAPAGAPPGTPSPLAAWFRAPERRWLLLRTRVKGAGRDPWPRLGDGPEPVVVARGDLYTILTNQPLPPR